MDAQAKITGMATGSRNWAPRESDVPTGMQGISACRSTNLRGIDRMKDSERWDNRAKAHYHQWKCYEFEARGQEVDVLNDKHYKDLITSYQELEKAAKKQAQRCRDWERSDE